MSGDINRVPLGLLTLLDMKARGNAPRSLSEQVIATLDLEPFYLQQIRLSAANSQVVGGTGFTTCGTVSTNEYWIVLEHSVYTSNVLAAGTTYAPAPAYFIPGGTGGPSRLYVSSPVQVFTTGQRVMNSYAPAGPRRLLPPGSSWGLWMNQVTVGTPEAMNTCIEYVPISI